MTIFSVSLDSSQVAPGDLIAAMPPLGSSLATNSVTVDRSAPHTTDRLDGIEEKPSPLDDTPGDIGASFDEKNPHSYADDYPGDVQFVNGQPIIETVNKTPHTSLNAC
jgi:hypothetical protein